MAPDELDRLGERIEALQAELQRLREEYEQSAGTPTQSLRDAESSQNGGKEEGGEPRPSWALRVRFFPRHHPFYSLAIIAIVVGLGVGGNYLWNYLQSYVSTSDARISGLISPISARVPGTVIQVLVRNDQAVESGQRLVVLDPRPYQLIVERARAILDEAKAETEAARRKYDTALAKLDEAQAANANPRMIKGATDMAAAARSLVAAKSAAEKAAKAELDEAQLRLRQTTIVAPVAGIAAKVSVNVGQEVQPPQRLLAIVQSGKIWVTAYFKETQLRRIRPGDAASIHVDALGRDYDGYVESIAPATKSEFSLLPSENATGNYVKVVQRVAVRLRFKPGQEQARLKPGMSVEPTIWLNGDAKK
jgi:membrane fusion protein (multidrug efflux system)